MSEHSRKTLASGAQQPGVSNPAQLRRRPPAPRRVRSLVVHVRRDRVCAHGHARLLQPRNVAALGGRLVVVRNDPHAHAAICNQRGEEVGIQEGFSSRRGLRQPPSCGRVMAQAGSPHSRAG